MRCCPYGARRIMQYLGGYRPGQKASKWAVTVSRHHDEISVVLPSAINNYLGWIALGSGVFKCDWLEIPVNKVCHRDIGFLE